MVQAIQSNLDAADDICNKSILAAQTSGINYHDEWCIQSHRWLLFNHTCNIIVIIQNFICLFPIADYPTQNILQQSLNYSTFLFIQNITSPEQFTTFINTHLITVITF